MAQPIHNHNPHTIIALTNWTHIGNIEINGELKGVYVLDTSNPQHPEAPMLSSETSKKCIKAFENIIKNLNPTERKALNIMSNIGIIPKNPSQAPILWTDGTASFESWRKFLDAFRGGDQSRLLEARVDQPQ
jgi:hypothetical protein